MLSVLKFIMADDFSPEPPQHKQEETSGGTQAERSKMFLCRSVGELNICTIERNCTNSSFIFRMDCYEMDTDNVDNE